jgi:hypothetical protein
MEHQDQHQEDGLLVAAALVDKILQVELEVLVVAVMEQVYHLEHPEHLEQQIPVVAQVVLVMLQVLMVDQVLLFCAT